MSLSRPKVTNPARRYFGWSGGAENEGTKDNPQWEGGKVTWYDKDAKEAVEVPMPFTFLVLENDLHSVGGYNDGLRTGYYANEVRDLQNGELVVRARVGGQPRVQAQGTYEEIKAEALNGLKYVKPVYIAFRNEEGELVIGNIKFSGAALTSWIELNKRVDVEKCAVVLVGPGEVKVKGKTHYFAPEFETTTVSSQTRAEARALDEQLQTYLDTYLAAKVDVSKDKYASNTDDLDEPDIEDTGKTMLSDGTVIEDDEEEEETQPAPKRKAAVPKETVGDTSIPLKDVPF